MRKRPTTLLDAHGVLGSSQRQTPSNTIKRLVSGNRFKGFNNPEHDRVLSTVVTARSPAQSLDLQPGRSSTRSLAGIAAGRRSKSTLARSGGSFWRHRHHGGDAEGSDEGGIANQETKEGWLVVPGSVPEDGEHTSLLEHESRGAGRPNVGESASEERDQLLRSPQLRRVRRSTHGDDKLKLVQRADIEWA